MENWEESKDLTVVLILIRGTAGNTKALPLHCLIDSATKDCLPLLIE